MLECHPEATRSPAGKMVAEKTFSLRSQGVLF